MTKLCALLTTPAHKQLDPAKQPGQIVNPLPASSPVPSKEYKPTHGGYPGTVQAK